MVGFKKIIIGSDHAGFDTKKYIIKNLGRKYEKIDLGTYDGDTSVDYNDYARIVSRAVIKTKNSVGILICGSGTGMCIAANRYKKIRAAIVFDEYSAKFSRLDNDSNIICLRGRNFSKKKCLELVKIWLKTPFSNKHRHKKRVKKLSMRT